MIRTLGTTARNYLSEQVETTFETFDFESLFKFEILPARSLKAIDLTDF